MLTLSDGQQSSALLGIWSFFGDSRPEYFHADSISGRLNPCIGTLIDVEEVDRFLDQKMDYIIFVCLIHLNASCLAASLTLS